MKAPEPQRDRSQRSLPGYEPRDANARFIFGVVLFLLLAGLLIHLVLGGLLARFNRKPAPTDALAGVHPLEKKAGPPRFPAPRLQVSPAMDLKALRESEEKQLNSYGWIDRQAGIVRIPVERAMDLLIARGVPTSQGTNGVSLGPSSYQLQQQRAQSSEPRAPR